MDIRQIYAQLKSLAIRVLPTDDPSHDFMHAIRVLEHATTIVEQEGGNVLVLTPAAFFHDLVNLPKDSPDAHKAPTLSANAARNLLLDLPDYPHDLIPEVWRCINECSFSNTAPTSPESAVLQDADRLEAVGVIGIMRSFATSGIMRRAFYHPNDPFAETPRELKPFQYTLDFFQTRLLQIPQRMNTETGRRLAREREPFFRAFLDQLRREIPVD